MIFQVIEGETVKKQKQREAKRASGSIIGSGSVVIEGEKVEPTKSVAFKAGSTADKLIKV